MRCFICNEIIPDKEVLSDAKGIVMPCKECRDIISETVNPEPDPELEDGEIENLDDRWDENEYYDDDYNYEDEDDGEEDYLD